MRVKLLEDRLVNGQPKIYRRPGRDYTVPAVKGTVLEVSDATGEKWIAAKKAVKTDEAPTRVTK